MSFERPDQIAVAAEALSRDYRLSSVREWKAETGGIAIGYMPIYVPRELLHAQGALPVGLMGGGDDLEIIRGDAFFQSYICHLPRSVIERAREVLVRHEVSEHQLSEELSPGGAPPHQDAIFAAIDREVLEQLRAADLDNMKPLDALNLLAKLKKQTSNS